MNHSQKEEYPKNADKPFRKTNQNADIKNEFINKINAKNKENSTDSPLLNVNHSNFLHKEFEEKNRKEAFIDKFKKNSKKINYVSEGEVDDSFFIFENKNSKVIINNENAINRELIIF